MAVKPLILISLIFSIFINAQKETCDSDTKDTKNDLNMINKCIIVKTGNSDSSTRKRFLRLRVQIAKVSSLKEVQKDSITIHKDSVKTFVHLTNKPLGISENVKALSVKDTLNMYYSKVFPIREIDQYPFVEKCAGKKGEDCFQYILAKAIQNNFAYPREAIEAELQGRVMVLLVISKEGNLISVEAAPGKKNRVLKEAAIRVFDKFPKMVPAHKDGKPVAIRFWQPIIFKLLNK